MNRLISWLSRRKLFTFFFSAAYLTAVSLGHKKVSGFFDGIKEQLSFRVYDSMMRDMGAVLLVLFSLILLDRIRRNKGRRTAGVAWWFFTAALVVGSYEVLIVFSVETVHFVQYALLAVPVFAMTMSFGETVGWVALMGAVDEAYQYFVLYAGNKTVYFDFNDIILNLVGAGIGVLMIYTLLDLKSAPFTAGGHAARRRLLSPSTALIVSVIVAGFVLHLSGIVELYPEANAAGAPVVLSRKLPPVQFWLKPAVGKSFHILSPTEGILVGLALVAAYSVMDICEKRAGYSSKKLNNGRKVQ